MYNIKNFVDNDDVVLKEEKGAFKSIEYKRDLSVTPFDAQAKYFSSNMNVRKKHVVCDLSVSPKLRSSYSGIQFCELLDP